MFSKAIIGQRQIFATANNSHTQISRPKRHRLTDFRERVKDKPDFYMKSGIFVLGAGIEPARPLLATGF